MELAFVLRNTLFNFLGFFSSTLWRLFELETLLWLLSCNERNLQAGAVT